MKNQRPCEKGCPAKAISMGPNKKASIDINEAGTAGGGEHSLFYQLLRLPVSHHVGPQGHLGHAGEAQPLQARHDLSVVSASCRGCLATRCVHACPKDAITIVNHRASIDHDKCITCGKCVSACQYSAIVLELLLFRHTGADKDYLGVRILLLQVQTNHHHGGGGMGDILVQLGVLLLHIAHAIPCSGTAACETALMKLKLGRLEGNFIEGMACEGGCVQGAGCLVRSPRNKLDVEKHAKDAKCGSR